jgi:hypothetical protein
MGTSTNVLEHKNSLCRDYLNWFAHNNCESTAPPCGVFYVDGEEARGEDLQRLDSFCRKNSLSGRKPENYSSEEDDISFYSILNKIGIGLIILFLGIAFIFVSKIHEKMQEAEIEAKLHGKTIKWSSEIWNSVKKAASEIGSKTISIFKTAAHALMPWKWKIFNRSAPSQNIDERSPDKADSDDGDEKNVMFYPTAVKPNEAVVAKQFKRFLRSGNSILLGIYARMAITKWNGKTKDEQRKYWKRDMNHSKGIGREVGSLPFSFVKEYVLIDVQRANAMLGNNPRELVSQLNSDPEIAASGLDIGRSVEVLQGVKDLLLDQYVKYPPDEEMVSTQIATSYRSVADEPNLLPYITKTAIGEWLVLSPEKRAAYVDKISTIPEPGGLPLSFIRHFMKRLNIQNPQKREDVLDFAPVFHQVAALDLNLNGEKYIKLRELAEIIYATWNSIAPSIQEIFGKRKTNGPMPAQFVRLARAAVESIAAHPVIYVKEKPWSNNGGNEEEFHNGINLTQIKKIIIEEIRELDEYPGLLNLLAERIANDWISAPANISKAFRQRDVEAELLSDAEQINARVPRPFIALWLMINGGLAEMPGARTRLAAFDDDDDDDPEDPNGNGAPAGGGGLSEPGGGQVTPLTPTGGAASRPINASNIMPQGAAMAAGGPIIAAPIPCQQTLFFGGAVLSPVMFGTQPVII